MKFQLDTKEKTIKVEESVNLGGFIEAISKLFPEGEWRDYKLETQTVINWTNPIVVEPLPHNPYPWYPSPIITYDTGTGGTYNIEVR